jgi:integral membrane sensor domain MASE1
VLGAFLLAAFVGGVVLGRLIGVWGCAVGVAVLLWAGTQSELEDGLGWWVGSVLGVVCVAGVGLGALGRSRAGSRQVR